MLRTVAARAVRPRRIAASPWIVARQACRCLSSTSSAPAPGPSPDRSSSSTRTTNTISEQEIAHFSSLSAHWWDPTGEFGLLHRMNPSRIEFMRDELIKDRELPPTNWLQGKEVLDVGCGGGIFAESIARLGANTLAIDASSANISVAQTHASLDPSLRLVNSDIPRPESLTAHDSSPSSRNRGSLEYRHCAAEDLVAQGKQFDVVCAMEVIEHVEDPAGFLECLMNLTKPGGHLLLSTISRTALAKLLTITMAEHVLRLVTPGTHTYSKYLKPEELQEFFDERKWWGMETRGCVYNPLRGRWRLLQPNEYFGLGQLANYFAGVRKPLQ
ncbi:hexaprenyldihydroxybenzoate methyltransferase [Sporobolomyces koalae]|uniref:hexaprenyldihydroxybenzoate methyltransferase n=1 Tax=Sporobolomyces koalae TaxID=500713 RepID=UPI00316EE8BE